MATEHDAFAALAQPLRDAARALENGKAGNGQAPAPASPAALDAGNESLGGDWSQTPVVDADRYARLLCISASDHLLAMADLLESKQTGLFSTYTVGRAVLEAASRAWYLTDPSIDSRERVRRYMNERLHNINEERLFLRGTGDTFADLDTQERNILAAAKTHGFAPAPSTDRRAAYLDTARRSALRLCGDVLADGSNGRKLGEATFRFLSAPAHGVESGLDIHLGDLADPNFKPTKRSETQAGYLIWPVKAYLRMGDRFINRFAWSTSSWTTKSKAAEDFWHQHARQGLPNGPTS